MTKSELLQNAKPILFNTEMVRAILNGRKTVTRRVVKPQPKMILNYIFAGANAGKWGYPSRYAHHFWGDQYKLEENVMPEDEKKVWTPPYHTDDILYVREAFCPNYFDESIAGYRNGEMRGNRNAYKADYRKEIVGDYVPEPKWTPSIHMPKEAARIFLRVTDVQVERLRDITEEQALLEGVPDDGDYPLENPVYCPVCKGEGVIGALHPVSFGYIEADCPYCDTPRKRFFNLFDSITKPANREHYGWDVNPWVWKIAFERIDKEEAMKGETR